MNYIDFFRFLEADKSRFISKIDTTEENKQLAIDFFNKHPNYESEIDWNRKDLSWEDIEEVMYKERISGTQLKKFVKKDKHFLVLYKDIKCVLYQPLTWLGSRYLASTDVKPKIEGKWCIAYQKDRSYWDNYSLTNKKSFIILCTATTKYALEIQASGIFVPWDTEDNRLEQPEFYDRISKEVPDIKSLLQKYLPLAISNHSLVEQFHRKDLEDCAYIEKVKREERQYRIKIFPKSFKRQVKKKGYYEWDGDITYQDLKDFGLVDERGKVDERVGSFKISGNLRFERSPITSITIPDSVTTISNFAFAYCKSLTSITIPNSVTSIDNYAFYFCSSLTEINIPNSVTSIGSSAFYFCSSLTEITIPNSVTSIGDYAFENCESLTEITIPDSVTKIGYATFSNCKSLTEITIPNSVTSIGNCAFSGCKSLTEITIPDSVTEIGERAFYYCTSLKAIYIDKEKYSLDLSNTNIKSSAKIYWKGEF